MAYLEQSTRYIAYDVRTRRPLPLLPRSRGPRLAARHPLRRRHGPPVRHLRRAAARCCRSGSRERYPKDPADSDFVYRQSIRAKAFDAAARHPAGGVAVQRRHLRHRPGLRAAAPAHAGPPAARGPGLRRPDAHRAAQGHPVVPQAGRPAPTAAARGAATSTTNREAHGATSPRSCSRPTTSAEPAPDRSRSSTSTPTARTRLVAAMLYPYVAPARGPARCARSRRMSVDEQARRRAGVRGRADATAATSRAGRSSARRTASTCCPTTAPSATCSATACSPSSGSALSPATATRCPRRWSRPASPTAFDGGDGPLRRPVRRAGRAASRAQAAYAVSLAYRVRYVMQMNAREAMHLIELRTGPQGHPAYRRGRPRRCTGSSPRRPATTPSPR